MKPSTYYLLALLLLAGSIPAYMALARHEVADPPRVATRSKAPAPAVVAFESRPASMTRNESAALAAIEAHRAKCVAGVVYRTADHVIEPWPGNVRCIDLGATAAVQASGG